MRYAFLSMLFLRVENALHSFLKNLNCFYNITGLRVACTYLTGNAEGIRCVAAQEKQLLNIQIIFLNALSVIFAL